MDWSKDDGKEVIKCTSNELRNLVLNSGSNNNGIQHKYYRVVCPRCYSRNVAKGERRYNNKNLSISKEYSFGKCFRCNAIFVDENLEYTKELDLTLDDRLFINEVNFKLIRLSNFDVFNTFTDVTESEDGMTYMSNRNKFFTNKTTQFHLMYKKGKLLIPYYYVDNSLMYYQFRYEDPKFSPTGSKYHNPVIQCKPIYIAPNSTGNVFWNLENPVILVEGALTAIALKMTVGDDFNVVALIGKELTDYQLLILKRLGFTDIYVMMDSTELSNVVVNTLSYNNIKSNVIDSSGSDAEEMLNELGLEPFRNYILHYINSSITYDFININWTCTPTKEELDRLNSPVDSSFFKVGSI